jgi:predicted porin
MSAPVYERLTQHGGSSSLTLENTDTTNSFTGSFGAQYALHKRFAIYAQTGVSYSRLKFTSTSTVALLGSESTSTSWHSGSSVGAAFYFW